MKGQDSNTFFKSWKDEDFYGPKASHVFLYGKIEASSVQQFRKELFEASKPIRTNTNVRVKPRPIVVHLHSPGGDGELGITLANFIREVTVPIAIVVDGYACSAATPMLVSASYRVMHEFSFVMFHEGSVNFHDMSIDGNFKESEIRYYMKTYLDTLDNEYYRIYSQNTSVPTNVLHNMLSRDIFMNASTCVKYKVVDRLIKLSKNNSMKRWSGYFKKFPDIQASSEPKSWKANAFNHLYNYNNTKMGDITAVLDVIKPITSIMTDRTADAPMPIILHSNRYMAPRSNLFDASTILVHIYLLNVPVTSVIDNNIDILQALPCILGWKRYMYDNVHITVSLVYDHRRLPMYYYDDIKHNTEILRSALVKLLRQYTKLPSSLLSTLFEKRIVLSAKQCKEYGLIDEIIYSKNRVTKGGCTCSQGLPLY